MKTFHLGGAQDSISFAGATAGSRVVPAGTVLLVVRGMILAHSFPVCLTTTEIAFNQDVKAVTPSPSLDGGFLAHWFVGNSNRMLRLVTEATHGTKRIDLVDLQRQGFDLPPLPEQRRIVEILDTLDEAIRRTEQVIAKLQKMKRGLLHDLLTRGIDENGDLRDPERHPDQFTDSPLGQIPREWEFGALGGWLVGPPKNGYSPKEADYFAGTKMLGLGCLTADGFEPRQLKNAPEGDCRVKGALVVEGDLLMSRSNTRDRVGLAGVYSDVGVRCIYPDLMMRLAPSDGTSARFLDAVLRCSRTRRQIQAAATGTSGSMVKVSARDVSGLLVGVPRLTEQAAILARLDSTTAVLSEEKGSSKKLRALKQGLMDDLLTGRVRVTAPGMATA